ncbi:O-antigen ligase family protein [Rhodoplanes sp. SY1]|uniref:O-antigen ligase family protein n=1 Tax=Rhodoplanes sp. SY1 TaxID=3166646 RepID=UPI0038B4BC71
MAPLIGRLAARGRPFLADADALRRRVADRHGASVLIACFTALFAAMFLTNSYSTPRNAWLALVLPAAILIGGPYWREAIRSSRILWAVLVYAVTLLLPVVLDPSGTLPAGGFPMASLQLAPSASFGAFTGAFLRNALFVLLFVTATGLLVARGPARCEDAVLACAAVVATSAVINVAVFVSTLPTWHDLSVVRLIATRGTPSYTNSTNISATYALFLVGSVAVAAVGQVAPWKRVVAVVVAAGLLLGVAATQSRSALAGGAAGLLVVLIVAGPVARWITLAVVVALVATVAVHPELQALVLSRGASDRPEVWSSYLDMLSWSPFLGFGARADLRIVLQNGMVLDQAHNLLLNALLRGGILAFAALGFVMAAGVYWARAWRRHGGSAVPLSMIVAMITFGQVDYALLITPPAWPWMTFWFPVGLCLGAEVWTRARRSGAPLDRPDTAPSCPVERVAG